MFTQLTKDVITHGMPDNQCVAPGAPTVLAFDNGSGSLTVSLRFPKFQGPTDSSTVCWSTVSGGPYTNCKTQAMPNTAFTVGAADGLIPGATYYFIGYGTSMNCQGPNGVEKSAVMPGVNAETTAWLARITANGGAAPSQAQINAHDAWCTAMKVNNLLSRCKFFNGLCRSNLVAARTPYIKGGTGDPWGNTGFVAGDLTANGLAGDGASKVLDTGGSPLSVYGITNTNNVSIGFYLNTVNSAANGIECGTFNLAGDTCLLLYSHAFAANFAGGCWDGGGVDGPSSASPNVGGFYHMSRTSSTLVKSYFANSGNAFAVKNTNVTPVTKSIFADFSMRLFACCSSGGAPFDFVNSRIGAFWGLDGMSDADSQTFYNIMQTFMTSAGGAV